VSQQILVDILPPPYVLLQFIILIYFFFHLSFLLVEDLHTLGKVLLYILSQDHHAGARCVGVIFCQELLHGCSNLRTYNVGFRSDYHEGAIGNLNYLKVFTVSSAGKLVVPIFSLFSFLNFFVQGPEDFQLFLFFRFQLAIEVVNFLLLIFALSAFSVLRVIDTDCCFSVYLGLFAFFHNLLAKDFGRIVAPCTLMLILEV
jgi:hypothetical protein